MVGTKNNLMIAVRLAGKKKGDYTELLAESPEESITCMDYSN